MKRLLLLLFSCFLLVGGFDKSTIVWSETDQIPISSIAKNDVILAYDNKSFCPDRVAIAKIKIEVDSYVVINLLNDDSPIICSRFQQFLTINNEWKKAIDLSVGDCLQGIGPLFIESISIVNKPIILYDLCVIPHHTFCVGKQKLVAHNFVPFIGLTISLLFGAGTAFEWSLFGGIAAAGLGIFGCAMNKNHKKKKMVVAPVVAVVMPNPIEPDDDNQDFFEKIKKNADKVVRTKKFGSMYRDPETQLWWSCDKARHGSSCYKVFKETARGFEWSHNLDMYGNIILHQHKGPIGLFISHKEVIICR